MDKFVTREEELQLVEQEGEAMSAVFKSPLVTTVKFILTDDEPNHNKQRVPREEFINIMNSGIFMPIKMAMGKIEDGHKGAIPIGVITHLKEEGNRIIGLAALWNKERPDDVEIIRKHYEEKRPLNLSWEIAYSDSKVDESGIENLINTALRAVTLVGIPAYGGRTPILAVASKENVDRVLNIVSALEIPEEVKKNIQAELTGITYAEENKEDELDEKEFQAKIDELNQKLADANKELTTIKEALSAKEKELQTQSEEVASLKSFKETVEKKEQEATKLTEIKQKFASVGIVKEDKYFTEHKDDLLALNDAQIDFMIQELVAFASASKNFQSIKKTTVPPINGGQVPSSDPKELAAQLKDYLSKK